MNAGRSGRIIGAVALVVIGVVAALTGLYLTWVSNCCGSPDPSDPGPALLGVLLGLACIGTAVVLVLRRR